MTWEWAVIRLSDNLIVERGSELRCRSIFNSYGKDYVKLKKRQVTEWEDAEYNV